MKAYKAFDKNLKCRGFQYEIGKEYKHEGKIELCSSGFHACEKLSDCFNYYPFGSNPRIAEVEIIGDVLHDSDNSKLVTNHLKILKELSWDEVLKLANSGDSNSGHSNSGNSNSGNWNSGNWNSGIFNTDQPDKVRVFNKYISRKKYESIKFPDFLYFNLTTWISHDTATDEEKKKYKTEIETCGGFVKTLGYKEAFKLSWDKANKENRMLIKKIPNFDKDLFFEISGINVEE